MATSKARDTDTSAAAESPPPAVLRVGLLVDSLVVPRWKRRIIEEVRSCAAARIAAVARRAVPPRRPLRQLLFRLYRALDYRWFRGEGSDALAPCDASDVLDDCPLAEAEGLAGLDLDVVIRLGDWRPAGDVARYGVWSLPDADTAFREVMEGRPTTLSFLEVRTARGAPRAVAPSHAFTDHISIHRTRNHICWKTAASVARTLRRLKEDGPAALEGETAPARRPPPGNLATCVLALRLGWRYLRRKVLALMTHEQWYPAYRFEEGEPRPPGEAFAGLTRLVPPKDRFWADPFPFVKDGRTYLFLEELPYARGKGHISVLELDAAGGGARAPVEVLRRDYHLSYPFVFEWEGAVYLLPETSGDRKVQLFRCRSFPDAWEEDRVLLDDVNAVDATLAEVDGRWWMFVNIGPPGAGNWDELHLYHADSPLGPWTPHRRNPVRSDCRAARPAGRLFRWQGELYRPAQRCAGQYGAAIALHRILRLDPEAYEEEHVADLAPDWAERAHTLNTGGGLHVVDVLHRPRRFF